MTLVLIACTATAVTFLGGSFALKFRDKLHLILGFSAGAVIGVAFFDLLPEAIALAGGRHSVETITAIAALGFALYLIADRMIVLHADHDPNGAHHHHRGNLGAASLSVHSFLDGVAIGLAFQVSQAIGIVVAIAVLVHDFSDGINTVNFILKQSGNAASARRWLAIDALAPLVGILSTRFFTLSAGALSLILALFCGFFLHIGASDLLPESHHSHPTKWTTISTLLGMTVMYAAIRLIG